MSIKKRSVVVLLRHIFALCMFFIVCLSFQKTKIQHSANVWCCNWWI